MSIRGGMLLTSRNWASLIPTCLATSAMRTVEGATHTDQLAKRGPLNSCRFFSKTSALSQGSKICGVPAAMMTGLFTEGLSDLKSSMGTPESLTAMATSMSLTMLMVLK